MRLSHSHSAPTGKEVRDGLGGAVKVQPPSSLADISQTGSGILCVLENSFSPAGT
jgi:hypothetical protein